MQRRHFLRNTGSAAAFSVFGASLPVTSSHAQDRFAKYKGQTLVISVPSQPFHQIATQAAPSRSMRSTTQVAPTMS